MCIVLSGKNTDFRVNITLVGSAFITNAHTTDSAYLEPSLKTKKNRVLTAAQENVSGSQQLMSPPSLSSTKIRRISMRG